MRRLRPLAGAALQMRVDELGTEAFAFERLDDLLLVVGTERLDGDAQLHGGLAVRGDELVVVQADDIALVVGDAMKMESLLRLRWLIPVRLSLRQVRHIITACLAAKRKFPKIRTENESWFLVPVRIRIGQGIEFDFCSVHSVWSLAQSGYETIIVNNNPETVSTDFDVADKLYFEPLTPEDVENIVDIEKPDGAVVQFGGQTAIKLTEALLKMGVPILGTSAENVDAAEDRELFDEILEQCKIPRPAGKTVFTTEEALAAANELGYPVLVRPSYVLGGQGMQIAINDDDIREFMSIINRHVQEHPILVDKYLMGKEVEVDAVCDGENILIPGIMEHVERAGIHSGDSISVYPAMSIKPEVQEVLVDYTAKLAKSLHVIGLINIQFIVYNDEVFVIEVNPRSSRTVPYISKVTGIPIVKLASRVILGEKITDMGYTPGLAKKSDYIAIKMPVFSFEKLRGAEISLGP